ncbi:uncharacterized protein ACRADG_013323 [Cochliomyia hominivorax]
MMFILNLKKSTITSVVLIVVCIFTISTTEAGGYTSEEIDEQSKSLYRAESSILASTENNKHQHKHTYYGSPCASGGCSGVFNPCSNPTGCPQPSASVFNNGQSINSGIPSPVVGIYANGGYDVGQSMNSGHGHVATPPQTPYAGVSGYAPPLPHQVSNTGYSAGNNIQPSSVNKPPTHQPLQVGYSGYTPQPYAHWNSPPSHFGYQGPRGYSVYDHSLKLNTEYTETGSHTGSLQRGNNGYGSGYGGGYNGLFNRPGF